MDQNITQRKVTAEKGICYNITLLCINDRNSFSLFLTLLEPGDLSTVTMSVSITTLCYIISLSLWDKLDTSQDRSPIILDSAGQLGHNNRKTPARLQVIPRHQEIISVKY